MSTDTMGQRAETSLRFKAGTVQAMLDWAKRAQPGTYCVYHSGNLSLDRLTDKPLSERADLAMLMQERGFARAIQMRRPGTVDALEYAVVRSQSSSLPRSVLAGDMTARDYRILAHLKAHCDSPGAMSIARAIRSFLATNNEVAVRAILKRAQVDNWIEPAEGNKNGGWVISKTGMALLR